MSTAITSSTQKVHLRRPIPGLMPTFDGALSVSGTAGSELFVVNKDAETLASDIDDPFEHGLTDSTNQNRAIVLINPGATYLDVFQIISGATAVTVSTALKVRGFGFVPIADEAGQLYPSDVDSTNYDAPTVATLGCNDFNGTRRAGYWIPLFNSSTGNHEYDFGTTVHIIKNDTTGSAKILQIIGGANANYYVAGCQRIVILVSQATVLSDTAVSCVMGRWVS